MTKKLLMSTFKLSKKGTRTGNLSKLQANRKLIP